MKSLKGFPYAYSQSFKLKENLSDEQLQDVCTSISQRIGKLINSNPRVSIVFPAYNEEMYLPLMLWTLSHITTGIPIEIIGVNNSSSDRTGEIIEQCGVIRIDENRKGVSYARQTGLEIAQGEIIATTDADSQIPPAWIDANIQYFQDDPDLVCLSGGALFHIHAFHKILRIIPKYIRLICGTERHNPYIPFLGANMFYKREAALETGGYALGFDLGEDNLIAQKMSQLGNVAHALDPDARVETSDRRINSVRKILQLYMSNVTRVNWLDRTQSPTSQAHSFSDIR